jgi:hypothetical protein
VVLAHRNPVLFRTSSHLYCSRSEPLPCFSARFNRDVNGVLDEVKLVLTRTIILINSSRTPRNPRRAGQQRGRLSRPRDGELVPPRPSRLLCSRLCTGRHASADRHAVTHPTWVNTDHDGLSTICLGNHSNGRPSHLISLRHFFPTTTTTTTLPSVSSILLKLKLDRKESLNAYTASLPMDTLFTPARRRTADAPSGSAVSLRWHGRRQASAGPRAGGKGTR